MTSACAISRVGPPTRQLGEHLALARRQLLEPLGEREAAAGRRPNGSITAASRPGPAARRRPRRPDRLEQVLRRHVLEQEPARAGAQRLVDVLVEVERRQDQDAGGVRPRPRAAGSPRCRPCAASGCPSAPRRARAARASVDRLARRRPPRRRPRGRARASRIIRKPAADQRLVVGEQHPDAHAAPPPSGSGARDARSRRSARGPASSSPP